MADNSIGSYRSPPVLPAQPVQPPAAPETPPEGQTGAAFARLAPQLAQSAIPNLGQRVPQGLAPVAGGTATLEAASAFGGHSVGVGSTPPALSVDPSIETFADDYLNKPADVQPETGRLNNLQALFVRNNGGQSPGGI